MRALLLMLILAIILVIAAVATGFLNVRAFGGGEPAEITAGKNGVSAKAGQPPAFDVETGSVKVGTKETTVKVPTIELQKAGHKQATAATNNAQ